MWAAPTALLHLHELCFFPRSILPADHYFKWRWSGIEFRVCSAETDRCPNWHCAPVGRAGIWPEPRTMETSCLLLHKNLEDSEHRNQLWRGDFWFPLNERCFKQKIFDKDENSRDNVWSNSQSFNLHVYVKALVVEVVVDIWCVVVVNMKCGAYSGRGQDTLPKIKPNSFINHKLRDCKFMWLEPLGLKSSHPNNASAQGLSKLIAIYPGLLKWYFMMM
jgi:hypothetical protein